MSEEKREIDILDTIVDDRTIKRDHDSVDDFEHLEHEQKQQSTTPDIQPVTNAIRFDDLIDMKTLETKVVHNRPNMIEEGDAKPVPATPPPSADFEKYETMTRSSDPFQGGITVDRTLLRQAEADLKATTATFMETERMADVAYHSQGQIEEDKKQEHDSSETKYGNAISNENSSSKNVEETMCKVTDEAPAQETKSEKINQILTSDPYHEIKSSETFDERPSITTESHVSLTSDGSPNESQNAFPTTKKTTITNDDSWNIVKNLDERAAPTKGSLENEEIPNLDNTDKFEMSNDFIVAETVGGNKKKSGADANLQAKKGPSTTVQKDTFEKKSEDEEKYSGHRSTTLDRPEQQRGLETIDDIEIAPKQIFRDMGLDAWFNPERLNPKVASLIYWRDPKKSGIVFGTILAVLLSLAYFSLISVLAYFSLLILTGTIAFRIYKTILQAVQKTADGHPFKEILDLDLTLPGEKVHEITDVAIAHLNAGVSELRRLFLVEDFVDSVKFGVLLWCLTYVGSWFNGMTLIIIGVVALFTLPKVYETNKVQIDQNLALVHGKINELTTKLKAAIPLGRKAEPTKEE